MSETHDPDSSPYAASGLGYLPGPGFGGGAGYPMGPGYAVPPPPPPRGHGKRALVITGVLALALGAAAGGLVNGLHSGASGTATATSKTMLSTSQIAARVDPGLVDIVSTDGLAQAQSAGTGIVLTSNGEILTNNHVINGATSIKVTDIGDGRTYPADVVGYDASHDVAVLQLQGASGLTTASIGDSSTVNVGDRVVGLGNAQGKGGTPAVATGSVTALDRSITAADDLSNTQEQLTGLIETNAPIQPGDSGGPLVNGYGQVIGMDTAAGPSYQFQGASSTTSAYAIPIATAMSIAHQIESGSGSATVHIGATGYLGVGIGSASGGGNFGGLGGGLGSSGTGAFLQRVAQGSPAAGAGLSAGDTLTSVGGTAISAAEDVKNVLVKYHPGDHIQVSWIDQQGQSHTATLTLATGPAA